MSATIKAGLPYRLGECNSSSMGGTDEVSVVFAAAVWGADFLLKVAERGVTGINLHTIFGSRGYTPIGFDKNTGRYSVRPIYYSMLMFRDAGQGKIIPLDIKTASNVTAHATMTADKKMRGVVVNKTLTQTVLATVVADSNRTHGTLSRLSAAAPTKKVAITYAGSSVGTDGKLSPAHPESIEGKEGRFEFNLPACGAAVLTLEARGGAAQR